MENLTIEQKKEEFRKFYDNAKRGIISKKQLLRMTKFVNQLKKNADLSKDEYCMLYDIKKFKELSIYNNDTMTSIFKDIRAGKDPKENPLYNEVNSEEVELLKTDNEAQVLNDKRRWFIGDFSQKDNDDFEKTRDALNADPNDKNNQIQYTYEMMDDYGVSSNATLYNRVNDENSYNEIKSDIKVNEQRRVFAKAKKKRDLEWYGQEYVDEDQELIQDSIQRKSNRIKDEIERLKNSEKV